MAAGESTTATQIPYRGLRVLSLDGGGVRGLAGLMILKYMMEAIDAQSPPKPCEVFDIIGGTSTGGQEASVFPMLRLSFHYRSLLSLETLSDFMLGQADNTDSLPLCLDDWV